ncbi:leucine-rich repeat domain-containing protein [Marinoscillum furvescens]|uniref:Disease resistance R13L4/SHOC-2-like LRR domain-containing protein n=1 Tax=Marinoscillum furvescens DSM 4134 TaxID=1122208 RepID=A0A3D9L5L4_MARFU|nr:hypothetical protein [Marinoscillum furvescens]REE01303.1 hypothetical protein C7460_104326 [Marinoscillum furvescens DSM 4134]
MQKILISIFLLMFNPKGIMKEGVRFANDKSVIITLDELESGKIPDSLWTSKQIIELKIQKTRPSKIWTSHPPLSWLENRELEPPFWSMPEKIGNLRNLEILILGNLDISELPNSITNLKNLEVLDISINKLQISQELNKLEKLQKLKTLIISGNRYAVHDVESLKEALSHTNIECSHELE